VVTHDLPGWGHANSLARAGAPTNKGNQNLQTEVLERLVERLTQPTAPRGSRGDGTKVPSEPLPHAIGVLFRLVVAASDEELPPIHGIFVNAKEEFRRGVLQTELEQFARLMRCPPVATQLVTQLLFTFEFKAQNEDNLERGLQRFVTTYSGEQ